MKFMDMPYARPNIKTMSDALDDLARQAANSQDGDALLDIFDQSQTLAANVNTSATIASIRYTINTKDSFYDGENDYFDTNTPLYTEKTLALYRALLAHPAKEALRQKYGNILLEKMEIAIKSSEERLIPLQQEENTLGSTYQKLYASARIPFMGQQLTVAQLAPYKQNTSRDVRKQAIEAEGSFFDANREELDDIYDKMVKNRTKQAEMMGYGSYTPLGNIRMERIGYTREDIKACRSAVAAHIVPLASQLYTMQGGRIGVPALTLYDVPLVFKDGNPTPHGTPEEILAAGQQMYRSLSPQTAEFIDFMMQNDLFDVLAKPGKAPGGYCTYIPNYKSPFIFSNFNGTAGDVDVLTHEAGHAFAAYVASGLNLPLELQNPGLESCEIHSMSMEFLTSDYHHLFFKQDTAKYEFSHAQDALLFLPYGCMVDEFQETVYDEPGLTPAQRNEYWLELEQKYRPGIARENLPFYSRGAGWQRQLHIYEAPFYYIDYVLAQAVALAFFAAHNQNKQETWQRYLALVQKAGTASYKELVHAAGFNTPFEEGALQATGNSIMDWLKKHPLA